MKRKLAYLLLLFVLSAQTVFGFTFTATPTPESCAGNGTISFSAFNADPNGTLVYVVYKLPELTIPYATITGNNVSGLSAGNYRIIARETVGSVTTTQQQDVVINSTIVPLVYNVQSLNQACSNTSNISVNTTSGIAVTYEIFSGPMLFPPQSSNTFVGLPVGVYKIRVFDNCGIGVVQTFTVNQNTAGITIGAPSFSDTVPQNCNLVIVTNTLTPSAGTVLGYPLAISYAIHPPNGGATINLNSNVVNGNPISQNVSITMPNYINQIYDYDIAITDACGSVYTQNFIIDNNVGLINSTVVLDCNQNFFELIASSFTPPYSLNFTSAPAGFNPNAFNASYPGPYSQATTVFGSNNNVVPFGNYSVEIVDSCGRRTIRTFSVLLNPPIPQAVSYNNGCLTNSGTIVVSIPSFEIVTATVVAAPSNYGFSLPHDVTALIDVSGTLTLSPVPLGNYTITMTDNCNSNLAPISTVVPVYVDQGLDARVRPGCDLGKTALRVFSNNGKLQTVSITVAPAAFGQTLPFNVSNYIASDGILYLNDFPGGNYTFSAVDECNFANTITVVAPSYSITTNSFSLQPNCGSFDIPLNFVSNGTINESFWLQKLIDANTNTWGHPATNTVYVNGSAPSPNDSLLLYNGTTNFNLSFNGTFRIVRAFNSYNNGIAITAGASIDSICLEILSPTLSFTQSLDILDANRIPCTSSGNLDVVITAVGFPPLNYSIIEKDGLPFSIINGTSNIFYNLGPGLYTFLVEDSCGNQVPQIFDVSTLISLVNITQPNDILQCQNVITNNETFDLTSQNGIILGSQSPTDYTLTYHTSLSDAQSNVNAITNLTNFNPTTNPQTIYARLVYNALSTCYEVRSFDLIVGQIPQFNLQPNYINCTSTPIDLDASVLNLPTTTYSWSNGATTPAITITQLGTTNHTVTATNSYGLNGSLTCTASANISVTISALPQIDHIETVDWTENENSITVYTSNNDAYEFSLDGNNYQSSNVFTNLLPGLYTVYVRDLNGCGVFTQEVWLLYYVKFFTPNGDGANERWTIKNANFEPDLKIVIYDRYGKIMANFDANSRGWDGTYNNLPMFATDYWFVVYRQDGRIHKGHFSLKR